jgi:ribonuclease D
MTIRLHRGDLPFLARYRTGAVAIDTETMGLEHRRDRLCVVQLSPGDGSADVVQMPPGAPGAPNLMRLLADPNILKIFHFARFDLGVLSQAFGVMPGPVYCTKVASRLARTYTDKHGLRTWCASCSASTSQAAAVLRLGRRRAQRRPGRLCGRGRSTCMRSGTSWTPCWRARGGTRWLACMRFLPDRARLDLAGWAAEDIFAHS